MGAITIHLTEAVLDRARAIADIVGRPLDVVVRDIIVDGIDTRARDTGIDDADRIDEVLANKSVGKEKP